MSDVSAAQGKKSGSTTKKISMAVVIAVVIGIILGFFFFYSSNESKSPGGGSGSFGMRKKRAGAALGFNAETTDESLLKKKLMDWLGIRKDPVKTQNSFSYRSTSVDGYTDGGVDGGGLDGGTAAQFVENYENMLRHSASQLQPNVSIDLEELFTETES